MLTEMIKPGSSTSIEAIRSLENSLNAALPESFVNFLLLYNGGRPKERAINFDSAKVGNGGDYIKRFYEISDNAAQDIAHKIKSIGDSIPTGCIFIASTPGGNYYLLSLRNDSFGKIYYKDHEYEDHTAFDPKNGLLPESIVFVSESFDDFIARLYDPDEV